MKSFLILALTLILGWNYTCAGSSNLVQEPAQASQPEDASFSILLFSRTTGFRHKSIPYSIEQIINMGIEEGIKVDTTENPLLFHLDHLSQYEAVVFLNTNGIDVLGPEQKEAFRSYIQQGGGYVGVHSASATEYDWPWYGELVGAYFDQHPTPQEATILVTDRHHPSTRHLPFRWTRFDEWYNYRTNPRQNVHVLMSLDENSYEGGLMGHDHPIAWAHEFDGGRSWYTGLGHTEESFAEPAFMQHLLGGIRWAAGQAEGDVRSTQAQNYDITVLDDAVTDPMELAIAEDGRVFYAERAGAIKMWDPVTEEVTMVGWIPVYMVIEDGLLGLTLDPDFQENNWIYTFYAPEDAGPSRLSRFTLVENKLDLTSEKVLLEVPFQRVDCCHHAGSLTFDDRGHLYLATGDNSNAYDPKGSPLNEIPGQSRQDAQRTAANTNDLRGKILRIHPEPDGSYTIPEGNLFEGDSLHKPEIYTMGHRNPFRISFDNATGRLYWGDVGNGNPPGERGGWGWDEFNQAKGPGFFGWPYFAGPNQPFIDYDYATETLGDPFNPEAPLNESPNNTGARTLPPAQPAMIWYTYGASEEFPILGAGGINPMAGPVLRSHASHSAEALPAYHDSKWLIYEWMRNWLMQVTLDEQGDLVKIDPFLPGLSFVRPTDVEQGPDGALYIAEWGDAFWGSNRNARIVRLEYRGTDQRAPVASIATDKSSGALPLTVRFSAAGSYGRNNDMGIHASWDFDGDGKEDARGIEARHTFTKMDQHTVTLTATDQSGLSSSAQVQISAGNTAPQIRILAPAHGSLFDFDQPFEYAIEATDVEEGTLDAAHTEIRLFTGFDHHEILLDTPQTLAGSLVMTHAYTHTPDLHLVDRYGILEACATDSAGLTSCMRHRLHPRIKEAEHTLTEKDATRKTHGVHPAAERYGDTALTVMVIENGSQLTYGPLHLDAIQVLQTRIKATHPGKITVHAGHAEGRVLGSALITDAMTSNVTALDQHASVAEALTHDEAVLVVGLDQAAYENWSDLDIALDQVSGVEQIVLAFESEASEPFLEMDRIVFLGGSE